MGDRLPWRTRRQADSRLPGRGWLGSRGRRGIDRSIVMYIIAHRGENRGLFRERAPTMSVENFGRLLHEAKVGKNDKQWFPRWIRRYASSVQVTEGRLPVSQDDVIRFLRSLVKSSTPAWQWLQAVRAIEAYRKQAARERGRANDADLHARVAAEYVCREESGRPVLGVRAEASARAGIGDGPRPASSGESAVPLHLDLKGRSGHSTSCIQPIITRGCAP